MLIRKIKQFLGEKKQLMGQSQKLKEICETVQNLQNKIISFFKNSKSVVVTRDEFMKCYE